MTDLLRTYGGPAPRYTSYPTAPHFGTDVSADTVAGWLRGMTARHASVYVHLPFCKSLCFYCGCHMKVTHDRATISRYVDGLLAEMAHAAAHLPHRLTVTTLHFGGGTPSYCPAPDLKRIVEAVHAHFDVATQAEISMEIDPRRLDDPVIGTLADVGLNRASLGIQDTQADVQQAIGRIQPHALNLRAAARLRQAGIRSLNVDLLYGLPRQTPNTLGRSIQDVLELAPERISLFGYAHVPWMKKHQRVLEAHGLPDAQQRLTLFETATEALTTAGYIAVGMDHFCLPDDAMATALHARTLHRNFMGYTTDDAPVLLGFGASAISQYPQGYAQNMTAIPDYMAAVNAQRIPTARGISLSAEDMLRRDIIASLLCSFEVDISDLLQRHHFSADILASSLAQLGGMMRDGLVDLADDGQHLRITPEGRPFARAVAACFDGWLDKNPARHSGAV